MRVTLRDVAERAGVHPGTASRALNPETQDLVSEATVRKVQHAAKVLAYRPNPMARGLKTNRSTMVAIVVPDLSNPLFPPIVRGAEVELSRAGYTSIIADTDNEAGRELAAFAALRARQVDGLLVASARRDDPAIAELFEQGVPAVLINRRSDGVALPAVTGDDERGIELAIAHLRELGHTAIAHLSGPRELSTGLSRQRTFRQVIAETGCDTSPDLVVECETYSVEAGAEGMHELLERARPTAVLAGNDQIAVGAIDALRERGLRCPEDVSVVGFNDMPFVDKLSPPLTTVRVPHAEVGAEAARILVRWMTRGEAASATTALPVELVVRGSTGRAPVRTAQAVSNTSG
ncbi:MAG: LacI family transcriptional regulator [Actinomycetales bacterium]|nr:LacI family transcriptional regulator [Actinomycetales bacterium]